MRQAAWGSRMPPEKPTGKLRTQETMKLPAFLTVVVPVLALGQASTSLLVDPDVGQSPLVIERFASAEVHVTVGFLVAPGGPEDITADVFLDGGKLLAPLAKDLPVTPVDSPEDPLPAKGTLSIPLKQTERPLNLQVIFKRKAAPAGEENVIGKALVRVIPPGALEAILKKRVQDTERPLRIVVFGKAEGLREMLTRWNLPFSDNGADPPGSTAAHTLMIGETNDRSHLPTLTPHASLFALSTDFRYDADSEIHDSESARSTIVRSYGIKDWANDPRLHRLIATHLSPR